MNSTGGKGVKVDIGNVSNMDVGSNEGDIGAGNNCNISGVYSLSDCWEVNAKRAYLWFLSGYLCIKTESVHWSGIQRFSTGGKGVKVDIGNVSNMDAGSNMGDIGAGNNCNILGEFYVSWAD